MSMVSLLLRYGMKDCSLDRAEMTSPSADSDLLMDMASCGTGREKEMMKEYNKRINLPAEIQMLENKKAFKDRIRYIYS